MLAAILARRPLRGAARTSSPFICRHLSGRPTDHFSTTAPIFWLRRDVSKLIQIWRRVATGFPAHCFARLKTIGLQNTRLLRPKAGGSKFCYDEEGQHTEQHGGERTVGKDGMNTRVWGLRLVWIFMIDADLLSHCINLTSMEEASLLSAFAISHRCLWGGKSQCRLREATCLSLPE